MNSDSSSVERKNWRYSYVKDIFSQQAKKIDCDSYCLKAIPPQTMAVWKITWSKRLVSMSKSPRILSESIWVLSESYTTHPICELKIEIAEKKNHPTYAFQEWNCMQIKELSTEFNASNWSYNLLVYVILGPGKTEEFIISPNLIDLQKPSLNHFVLWKKKLAKRHAVFVAHGHLLRTC